MKKLILLTMTALLAICADGQTRKEKRDAQFKENFPFKYEVTLGWAGYPILDDFKWGNGWGCSACAAMSDIYNMGNLNHIYRTVNGGEYMTGLISGEINIHHKSWYTFSFEAGVNGIWGSRYNKLDGSLVNKMHGAAVTLLPQAQFNWLNTKTVRLYSSVGLGLSLGAYDDDFQAYPAAQLTPIGITAGQKVFFFAEQSLGTAYLGGKFGLGYRF